MLNLILTFDISCFNFNKFGFQNQRWFLFHSCKCRIPTYHFKHKQNHGLFSPKKKVKNHELFFKELSPHFITIEIKKK